MQPKNRSNPLHRLFPIAIALLTSLALAAAPAMACSCMASDSGFLLSTDGRLPADARGIPWSGWGTMVDGEFESSTGGVFEVIELGAQGEVEHAAEVEPVEGPEGWTNRYGLKTLLVRPASGWAEGATYRVAFVADEEKRSMEVEVTIDPTRLQEASTDGAVVTTTASGQEELSIAAGASCGVLYEAGWVDVTLQLPSAFEPYRESLLYITHVDGTVWQPSSSLCWFIPQGRSWREVGEQRLFVDCDKEPKHRLGSHKPVSEGPHTVRMTAFLPGTNLVIEAETEVEMDCEGLGWWPFS